MIYYLQDSRNYVGNCMLWWCKDNKGYTTNLDKAKQYSEEEKQLGSPRTTDIFWNKLYIDGISNLTVDFQNADIKFAKVK